jgi:hypothetical protein
MERTYETWPTLPNTVELSKVSVKDLQQGFGFNESIGLRGKLTRVPGGGVERVVASTRTGDIHPDDMVYFKKCTLQKPSLHLQKIQSPLMENRIVSALLTDPSWVENSGWKDHQNESI